MRGLTENVTLICIDCINVDRAIEVIELCKKQVNFKNVKLLTSLDTNYIHKFKIPHIGSLEEYSKFCIQELHKYFDTSHVLIVQHDGWILNPECWDDNWLNYDYIGCFTMWTEQGEAGKGGNGGFSLRSKNLLKKASEILTDFHAEDIVLSAIGQYWHHIGQRNVFEGLGFKFADNSIMKKWGWEFVPYDDKITTFGVHRQNVSCHPKYKEFFCKKFYKKIKSATYGSDEREIDVTEIVRNMNEIVVSNDTFGNDPHWGVVKKLRITFEDGSIIEEREGGSVFNESELEKSLKSLFLKFGSDKSTVHSYEVIYEQFFKRIKDKKLNILEIGCLNGSSLKAWEEYFPNSIIYGIDINDLNVKSDRIIFKKMNGTDEKSINDNFSGIKFDIIIDDASHYISDQIKSHQILSSFLSEDGMYFIEDIQNFEKASKNEYFRNWNKIDHRTIKGRYDDVVFVNLL